MDAEDTLFRLYTSGSTGTPKGMEHCARHGHEATHVSGDLRHAALSEGHCPLYLFRARAHTHTQT